MGYTQEQKETYRAAWVDCAYRDRTDLGFIEARGADRYTWLQGMVSQDMRLLENGEARVYAYFLNATGHILAELKIARAEGAKPCLLLAVARENAQSLLEKLDRFLIMEDVELRDASDEVACIELWGAKTEERLLDLHPEIAGGTLITTFTGAEWYGSAESAKALRTALQALSIPEIDDTAAEALRIEAGIPRYPNELNESVIALEANNSATHISFTKGCYIGQEIIARIDSRGHTNRALTGFVALDGGALMVGDKLFTLEDNREVGKLTSVLEESPRSGDALALGYLRHEFRDAGTVVVARGEGRESRAKVAELPFAETVC